MTSRPHTSELNVGAPDSVDRRPLIAHVIYRLAVGGLENGLVNLINRTPQYRHAIVCMTDYTDFSRRIEHDAVSLHALHKREGHDLAVYWRLWRLLRALRPDILHTRNMSALEAQLPGWLAGVRGRMHGEHGRDVHDLDGSNRRYQRLRRLLRPLVQRYIPLSQDLERYLLERIDVPADKIAQIYNGVDTERFYPAAARESLPWNGVTSDSVVFGTVGRMQAVKDQMTLVRAFIETSRCAPELRPRLRLVMIGDGPLRAEAEALLEAESARDLAWVPGERDDVPDLMRGMDVFVLPSKAEGISNTILEAMACGLPVVATRVGGNAELVEEGVTGYLVEAEQVSAMKEAMLRYAQDESLRREHGQAARTRVERQFSMSAMVGRYVSEYEDILTKICANKDSFSEQQNRL